ncbi:MAG: toll/interleukin-1 receptor domain-containing protein [Pseudomonadota bacterium]
MVSKTEIFLSHAAADKSMIERFEVFLSRATATPSSNIFCTSLEGQGVPKGKNFVDHIRSKVTEAKVVIAFITRNYLDSPFCMAELGAVWALGRDHFPIVVPPLDFDVLNATQLGVVGVKLDNQSAMLQMCEDICDALSKLDSLKVGLATQAIKTFYSDISPELQEISKCETVSTTSSYVPSEEFHFCGYLISPHDAISRVLAKYPETRRLRIFSSTSTLTARLFERQFHEGYRADSVTLLLSIPHHHIFRQDAATMDTNVDSAIAKWRSFHQNGWISRLEILRYDFPPVSNLIIFDEIAIVEGFYSPKDGWSTGFEYSASSVLMSYDSDFSYFEARADWFDKIKNYFSSRGSVEFFSEVTR